MPAPAPAPRRQRDLIRLTTRNFPRALRDRVRIAAAEEQARTGERVSLEAMLVRAVQTGIAAIEKAAQRPR